MAIQYRLIIITICKHNVYSPEQQVAVAWSRAVPGSPWEIVVIHNYNL